MIFCTVNEKGERKIDKILALKPWEIMTTRRINPVSLGKSIAVQPNRGITQVCRIIPISCENSLVHYKRTCPMDGIRQWKQHEAELEGFLSWDGLIQCLTSMGIQFGDTFRIEFKKEY